MNRQLFPLAAAPHAHLPAVASLAPQQRAPWTRIASLPTLGLLLTGAPLLLIAVLLGALVFTGAPRWEGSFLTTFPSPEAVRAGLLPAVVGSVALTAAALALAFPVGLATAFHLVEFAAPTPWTRLLLWNLSLLRSVPPVLFGLLGLQLFVHDAELGFSTTAGAATLAMALLPSIAGDCRAALQRIPAEERSAAEALGCTRWETFHGLVLPAAAPHLLAALLRAAGRALGATAPLLALGMLSTVTFLPTGPQSAFSTVPLQSFDWLNRWDGDFLVNAAAALTLLLAAVLPLKWGALRLERQGANCIRPGSGA